MLLLTLASAAASILVGYLSARVAAGLARNLRKQLFVRVESFSNTEFDKFSTASLITRSTNDITQIQMLMVMLFRIVFYAPTLAIGGIFKVKMPTSMLWIIAAAVRGITIDDDAGHLHRCPSEIQSDEDPLIDKLNLATREILTGMMVIRAFNTQKQEEERFDIANQI